MSQIEGICFNSILTNLKPDSWYMGCDFLGRYTDDIIYFTQQVIDRRSIFQEFPKYLNEMVHSGRLNKEVAEVLDSRFGLFTFNYDEELRTRYYDIYFHTSALIDSKSLEIKCLDELMEKYIDLPEVLASENDKEQLLKYIDGVKMAAELEDENLEILRKYYSTNNLKDSESELKKEKAYNILNSLMLKEEAFDLITKYTINELKLVSHKYRITLYDLTLEELNRKDPTAS